MQYLWIVNLTERILIMQFSNLSVKISSREIQLKSSRCIRFYKLLLNRRNIENVEQRRSILERVKLIPPFLHFFFAFNLTRVPMIMIRWSSACIVCSRFRRGYRGLIPLSILGIATAFKLPPCHVSLPFRWPPQNHEGRSTLLFSLTYLRSYVIYPPIWYVDGTTRGPGHSYDPTIPHIGGPHTPLTYNVVRGPNKQWSRVNRTNRTKLGNPTPFLPRSTRLTRRIVHHLGFLYVFKRSQQLIHSRGKPADLIAAAVYLKETW